MSDPSKPWHNVLVCVVPDPQRPEWQRDVAVSFGRVAMIEAREGQAEAALARFRKGRDIIARLVDLMPENAALPNDLAWFEGQIAALGSAPGGGTLA